MAELEPVADPANRGSTAVPYSDAIRAGSLLFVSGQLGVAPGTETPAPSIELQTRTALENLSRVLAAAGASVRNVASVTIFLARNDDRPGMNAVYREFFADHKPARSTVAVQLGRPGVLIEIQAIAVL